MAEQDIAAAKAMRRKKAAKLGMRIAGVSMLAGASGYYHQKILTKSSWKTTGRMDWGEGMDDDCSSTNRQKE